MARLRQVRMLLTRVFSALVLAPIILLAIWLGGWVLAAVLGVVLGAAAWELARLMEHGGYHPAWWLSLALIVACQF